MEAFASFLICELKSEIFPDRRFAAQLKKRSADDGLMFESGHVVPSRDSGYPG